MMGVRASFGCVWRMLCALGFWVMYALARLFFAIAAAFQWVGTRCKRTADWLFNRANRIADVTRSRGGA